MAFTASSMRQSRSCSLSDTIVWHVSGGITDQAGYLCHLLRNVDNRLDEPTIKAQWPESEAKNLHAASQILLHSLWKLLNENPSYFCMLSIVLQCHLTFTVYESDEIENPVCLQHEWFYSERFQGTGELGGLLASCRTNLLSRSMVTYIILQGVTFTLVFCAAMTFASNWPSCIKEWCANMTPRHSDVQLVYWIINYFPFHSEVTCFLDSLLAIRNCFPK